MGAVLPTPINTTITTSTWTPISLGIGQTSSAMIVGTRGGNPWKISDDPSGATYFTIKADSPPIEIYTGRYVGPNTVLFYAQALSLDDTLEVLLIR
jgi:hypothetical protein